MSREVEENEDDWRTGKELLVRIVSMLTRMVTRADAVREDGAAYGYVYEYGEEIDAPRVC